MENIGDVIGEWAQTAEKKPLRERDFDFERAITESRDRVISITGVRRSGKSSLLMLIYRRIAAKGGKAVYVNVEDDRLRFKGALDEILKHAKDAEWLLLDEVANAPGWEGWMHRINEMKSIRLITASSLNKLSRFPPRELRGRITYFELFPLSFREFLEFKGIEPAKTVRGIGAAERALEEYLVFGGFPEAVISENKAGILQEYVNSIVSLDVAALSDIPLRVVFDFYSQLAGTTFFSATKTERVLKSAGHSVGKGTLLELERLLEAAYLAFFVQIYSTKIKDRTLYPRKVYLVDCGLFYAATGKKDWGRFYENAVFLQLRRKLGQLEQIVYYRSQENREVDFAVKSGSRIKMLIQVAYEIDERIKEREVGALVEAAQEFGLSGKGSELLVITRDLKKTEDVRGKRITYVRLRAWLLEEE